MRRALVVALFSSTAFAAPLSAKVTLYHFNLQYVAGGMERFPDGISRDPNFNLSEQKVEDLIITESFAPLLDVLERHPSWHVDLEMQGMMIEAMAARHVATLDKLRTLAKAGRVEVVSFHYSDQLFVAYPKRDLVRSVLRNKKVFADHDVPLSKVVFNQEGQFNEGMLKVMAENGFSIAVLASNLYGFQHDTALPSKFMQKYGVDIAVSGGGTVGDLTTDWDGPGDGELIVTNNTNPYLGLMGFHVWPEEVQKWEQENVDAETAGKKLLTVSEVTAEAKARGAFPMMPPLADGTWRPKDTHNLLRWMGGLGGLFDLYLPTEKDDAVLTANTQASVDVAACEAVVKWAADKPGHAERVAAADEAGRELMLAQCSDSTGWNPWLGEVKYSLDHAQKAKDAAKRCIDAVELRGAKKRRIDLKTGTVTDDGAALDVVSGTDATAPFMVTTDAPGREVTLKWKRLTAERLELTVDATAGTNKNDHRKLSLVFPMGFDRLLYSPACDETNLEDLPVSTFTAGVEHTIPAPSGLVGLGPDQFLLKDIRVSHLAVLVRPGVKELEVRDETLRSDEPAHWRLEIIDAAGTRAVEVAHALNVTPTVEVELTPKEGCGCSSVEGVFAALALVLFRRRRS